MRTTAMVLAAAAIAGTAAAPASADVIEFAELHMSAFDAVLTPGVTTVSLPRFDDRNGTRELREVSLLVNAAMSAHVAVENEAAIAAPDLALGMAGFMTVEFGPLATLLDFQSIRFTDGVGPTDGIAGSGADLWDFGLVRVETSASDTTRSLEPFVGTGTIDAQITASGSFAVTGTSESTLTVDDFMTTGNLQIVYGYAQIPAPAALGLLLTGALVRRRRRRAA